MTNSGEIDGFGGSGEGSQGEAAPKQLTRAEMELYDRQIRLWGLDAQNRLRNSNVLLYGLSPLGAEIAKNLMLCGVNTFTIADSAHVQPEDSANFFFGEGGLPLGKNRAEAAKHGVQVLNPHVKLTAREVSLAELQNEDFLMYFDLVILADQCREVISAVNDLCRAQAIRFIAGNVFGWTGFAFFDFDTIEFLVDAPKQHNVVEHDDDPDSGEVAKKRAKTDEIAKITIDDDKIKRKFYFPSFEEAFVVDPEKLTKKIIRRTKPGIFLLNKILLTVEQLNGRSVEADDLMEYAAANPSVATDLALQALASDGDGKPDPLYISPPVMPSVNAIVGAVLSQEAIKSLSQNGEPVNNVFAYSAVTSVGHVYKLPLGLDI